MSLICNAPSYQCILPQNSLLKVRRTIPDIRIALIVIDVALNLALNGHPGTSQYPRGAVGLEAGPSGGSRGLLMTQVP